MCNYWQQEGWVPSGVTTIVTVLTQIDQTVALSEFLIWKCRLGIAASSVRKFPAALRHILNFYDIPNTLNRSTIEGVVTTCKKTWGLAPKPTAAIPKKILRLLLQFLKKTNFNKFCFFAFAFLCATRVSEILNLTKSDFTFSPACSDRQWVRIKFRNTKTRSEHKEDGHTITFHKSQRLPQSQTQERNYQIDPYELSVYWYREALSHPQGFVAPWVGSYATRSRRLYSWFSDIKRTFAFYLKTRKNLDIDISNWRFHTLRTTYVGVMRSIGLSWEQIQLRTGHKYDSQVTRDTYFMNALLSEQFDDTFDKLIQNDLSAQQIFLLENEPTDLENQALDDQMHEEFFSTITQHPANNPVISTPEKIVRTLKKRKRIRTRAHPLGLASTLAPRKRKRTAFRTPTRARTTMMKKKVKRGYNSTHSTTTIFQPRPCIRKRSLTSRKRLTRVRQTPDNPQPRIHHRTTNSTKKFSPFSPVSACPYISSPLTENDEKLFAHIYKKSLTEIPHEDEWLPPEFMPRTSPTPPKPRKSRRFRTRQKP